jgi:hypothetical protein
MAGVRVLDLATFVAAPYAASILGEFAEKADMGRLLTQSGHFG